MAAEPETRDVSRQRIAEAGGRWQRVLDVGVFAPVEEVKTAFRRLALLHHPDKGGDADTFKRVQEAYEEGVRKCRLRPLRRAKAKSRPPERPRPKPAKAAHAAAEPGRGRGRGARAASPPDRTAPKRPPVVEAAPPARGRGRADGPGRGRGRPRGSKRPEPEPAPAEPEPAQPRGPAQKKGRWRPVPANATKAKVQQAVERWQNSVDREHKTMPDEIPMVRPEVFSAWLRAGLCIPVDVRESHESTGAQMQSAEPLTYMQLLMEPDRAVPQVARLRRDGRRLVIVSQHARRMDNCGLVAAVLVDVFGFSEGSIHRLEGGYASWSQWLKREGAGCSSLEPHEPPAAEALAGPAAPHPGDGHAAAGQAAAGPAAAGHAAAGHAAAGRRPGAREEEAAPQASRRKASHASRPADPEGAQCSAEAALGAAQDAQRRAEAALASAREELALYEAAVNTSLCTLVRGLWATEAEAQRCLDELSPLIAKLDLDASLRSMLPRAATKPPAQRGTLDSMVLQELAKRFTRKVEELRESMSGHAAEAAERQASVRAAQDALQVAHALGLHCWEAPAP